MKELYKDVTSSPLKITSFFTPISQIMWVALRRVDIIRFPVRLPDWRAGIRGGIPSGRVAAYTSRKHDGHAGSRGERGGILFIGNDAKRGWCRARHRPSGWLRRIYSHSSSWTITFLLWKNHKAGSGWEGGGVGGGDWLPSVPCSLLVK